MLVSNSGGKKDPNGAEIKLFPSGSLKTIVKGNFLPVAKSSRLAKNSLKLLLVWDTEGSFE
jgi:hypothetical protein